MKASFFKSLFTLLFLGVAYAGTAQEFSQMVRGTIIDQDSRMPVVGANVVIVGSDPFKGASTDLDGNFRIEDVPVGRITLQITCLTFEDMVLPNMLVGSGKEIVLNLEMVESVVKLDQVEITATENKNEVMNDMATVSARTFSVEETSRYAGSFNDPARMVAGFAGVTSDAEGDNDIVVRGNSPKGIQWRLEGVEIPNPNHFSDEGSTGGPINALNSAMLSNSDFYAGAFAPEFGNAFSGLFDIRLRQGNNEQREYAFQIGVLGTDFTAEGPFRKGGKASYLVNYRYSSLALLDQAGIVDFNGVPKYQDASFKLHLPTEKAGVFSLFGLGGKSNILEKGYETEAEEKLTSTFDYGADMGVVGLNHTYLLSSKSYLKSSISVSENSSAVYNDELGTNGEFYLDDEGKIAKVTGRVATTLNHKFDAQNKIRVGAIYSHHAYDMDLSYFNEELDRRQTELKQKGDAGVMQAFASWQLRPTEDITITSGFHFLHFNLNNAQSIEPRVGLRWKLDSRNVITAGFGMHSKVESLTNYFAERYRPDGTSYQPNLDLGLQKARHYVLGFEHNFNPNLYFKTELYYQELYDLPVEYDVNSSFSLVNSSEWFTDRILVNEGTGANYGIEMTLERFFDRGFFYMLTASLYDSKYTALDGVQRDTRYNGQYVGNVLFGKEMPYGKAEKNRTLSINARVSLIGGKRYTPIDLEASIAEGGQVRDDSKIFGAKGDDVFLANLAVSFRRERANSTHELKFDVQNATNNQAVVREYYDSEEQKIVNSTQLPLLPVISYRIAF